METLDSVVAAMATKWNVAEAHVRAIVEVESAGRGFSVVNTRNGQRIHFPTYRHEGHWFYKLLKEPKRAVAVHKGLAAKGVGSVKNPSSQQARYTRIFEPACDIDPEIAVQSSSWGVGQVMGFNAHDLGFSSALKMLEHANTLEGQVDLIFRFFEAKGILDDVQAGRWTVVARIYNGSGYRRNKYDTRLAAAARRWGGSLPVVNGMLQTGSKGPRVREIQRLLQRAGHPLKVDGDFGDATLGAVRAFQTDAAIDVDGIVGPETLRRLKSFAQPAENLQKVEPTNLPNVGKIATTIGTAVVTGVSGLSVEKINEVKTQIEVAAKKVEVLTTYSAFFEQVSDYLLAGAGILGVAAAAWGVWEFVRAQRSYEGVSA